MSHACISTSFTLPSPSRRLLAEFAFDERGTVMWNWLKDAVGRQSSSPAKRPSSGAGKQPVKQAGAPSAAVSPRPPVDAAEQLLDAERTAVRESFRSDPATVVAVLRAWLREDAQRTTPDQGAQTSGSEHGGRSG
ncbi:MAG: hypothetical protein ACKO3C_14925 [Betaproteobacteria bacterium]|nr:hypothetical protein [Betaproteobacteria bacterium]